MTEMHGGKLKVDTLNAYRWARGLVSDAPWVHQNSLVISGISLSFSSLYSPIPQIPQIFKDKKNLKKSSKFIEILIENFKIVF